MIKVVHSKAYRVSQGDIYRNVEYIEYIVESEGNIEISKIVFPLIIVLTQDCDLAQDYKFRSNTEKGEMSQDKLLLSVLVAPLYNAEFVFRGEHLSELDLTMQIISKNKTPGNYLMQNNLPRYHYLEFPEDIPIVPSVIDFKHYFSLNIEYLRKTKTNDYVCRVADLYREDVSQRFSSFLSRIGLP